jgi:hypothetical protein
LLKSKRILQTKRRSPARRKWLHKTSYLNLTWNDPVHYWGDVLMVYINFMCTMHINVTSVMWDCWYVVDSKFIIANHWDLWNCLQIVNTHLIAIHCMFSCWNIR